ncbi:Scr1 family TA system antitoxin-like transcriptional regulator [Streptomyces sp. NPDC015032]|uniref:Scr1 family TA system antitoxin-like transcriptional regulator n=1 Tax=Streptomyces sp. NPDC015032 TaxID=3364937 RepID=UPI0036FBB8E8
MPVVTHPAIRAMGGYLRDARERRCILPEEPAELLNVSPESVLAMEAGHTQITPQHIGLLCRLYHCNSDSDALKHLVSAAIHRSADVADAASGHHRRLTGCARQAKAVRWLATDLVPPLVQTAAYTHAIDSPPHALPDAPLPFQTKPDILLDERVLHTASISPDVMAEQLQHLLDQEDFEVRVVPGRMPSRPARMVLMTMPAGFVIAHPASHGVLYRPSEQPPPQITETWNLTTPALSRHLLARAAEQQRARIRVHAGAV